MTSPAVLEAGRRIALALSAGDRPNLLREDLGLRVAAGLADDPACLVRLVEALEALVASHTPASLLSERFGGVSRG